MNKKIFPLLIGCIFIFTCGFFFFSKTPEAYIERALDQLKAGELIEADKTLDALERDHPSYPTSLYRGYLAQSKRKFKEAERHFQILSDFPVKGVTFEELSLARATNDFFEGRDEEFFRHLNAAQDSMQGTSFYDGLMLYLQEQYSEALEIWSPLFVTSSEPQNPNWQEVLLQKLFSPQWVELHVAHCLMEEGDIGNAQRLLEGYLHEKSDDNIDYQPLANLFLAMAALKEARLLPQSERESDYKLARFYFDKGSVSPAFYREKQLAVRALAAEAKILLQNPDLRHWGLSFIHLLEDWKAMQELEEISEMAVGTFFRNGQIDSQLCSLLQQEFGGTTFHTFLMNKLAAKTSECIAARECQALLPLWETIERLALDPNTIAIKMGSEVTEEIFKTIHHDSESLPMTLEYLEFWKQLEKDPARHFHLAHSLIGHGEMLWKKEGQEVKGTKLMEISLQLVAEEKRQPLLKEVENFLVALYRDAEQANMIHRLSLIYDALAFFHLGTQTLASPASLANHLADADYLFRARRFSAAQIHAEWVLKFEPNNIEALRVYGLSTFHLGDYKKAEIALKKLPGLDENCRKALILSEAFSSQPQDHLAQRNSVEEKREL